MATTGSSLAAINAGIIPEATPTNDEIPMPNMIFLNINVSTNDPRSMNVHKYTINNPKHPPIRLRNIASNKNWKRMK